MSININSVICPECGANLPIEDNRTQLFCSYCGNKIIVPPTKKRTYVRPITIKQTREKGNAFEIVKNIISENIGQTGKTISAKINSIPNKKLFILISSVLFFFVILIFLSSVIAFTGKTAMLNVTGKPYSDAIKILEDAGFTNISATVNIDTDKTDWIVISQSVNVGKKIKLKDKIELTCAAKCFICLEINPENNLNFSQYSIVIFLDGTEIGTVGTGKTMTYTAKILSGSHTLSFNKSGDFYPLCNRNLDVFSDEIYFCELACGRESIDIKKENILNYPRGSLEKKLEASTNKPPLQESTTSDDNAFKTPENTETEQTIADIENSKTEIDTTEISQSELVEPEMTSAVIEELTSILDEPSNNNSGMPIMLGTNINTVIEAAKEYGLSRPFSDDDFGHGTKMCSLSSKNGGLMLDVIYSATTNEILCGRIVTVNTLSSSDEQKSFVKAMSTVLCPENDKTDISNWVKTNVGASAETTINSFIYEVELGPTGNVLYHAGERNWEEWDYSFD